MNTQQLWHTTTWHPSQTPPTSLIMHQYCNTDSSTAKYTGIHMRQHWSRPFGCVKEIKLYSVNSEQFPHDPICGQIIIQEINDQYFLELDDRQHWLTEEVSVRRRSVHCSTAAWVEPSCPAILSLPIYIRHEYSRRNLTAVRHSIHDIQSSRSIYTQN